MIHPEETTALSVANLAEYLDLPNSDEVKCSKAGEQPKTRKSWPASKQIKGVCRSRISLVCVFAWCLGQYSNSSFRLSPTRRSYRHSESEEILLMTLVFDFMKQRHWEDRYRRVRHPAIAQQNSPPSFPRRAATSMGLQKLYLARAFRVHRSYLSNIPGPWRRPLHVFHCTLHLTTGV